jgi:hypothetical protein
MKTSRTLLTVLVLALLTFGAGEISASPIPQQPYARPVAPFIGQEATPNPITSRPIPQNPYMSSGSWGSVHDDTYMSDTYFTPGPLGKASMTVVSTSLATQNASGQTINGIGGSTAVDSAGRLVVSVIRQNLTTGEAWAELTLMDPVNLDTLATLDLPSQILPLGTRPASIYLYQDQQDRTVIGTPLRTVWVVSHTATAFSKEAVYDLNKNPGTGIGIPSDDNIQALQPDFAGRLWFTSDHGVVGTLDMQTGEMLGSIPLTGERIVNGTAADEDGGVYVVTTRAMYRFDADAQGKPVITWQEAYDAGTHVKPGQVDIGSGTTPTVMGEDYVTITDNAEPQMNVLVYRRAKNIQGARLLCAVPVFRPGPSSNESSLVATDKSIIVENNFGYKSPKSTENGKTTRPGIARIDVDASGCQTVWTNTGVSIPTAVTKISLATGLIYVYTKPKGPVNTDPWYFIAIDFETGQTVYRQLAGTGIGFDNSYAAVTIGPDGTAYVGVLGGVVAIRDRQ